MFVYCETSNKRPIAFIADSAFIVTATAIVRVLVVPTSFFFLGSRLFLTLLRSTVSVIS